MAGGMGGGWGKRGAGIPLAERRRVARAPDGEPATGDGSPASGSGRHCWVADAVDDLGEKRAGLLVEWRRHDGQWWGRVVYVAALRPEWVLVEEWLPADRLSPV